MVFPWWNVYNSEFFKGFYEITKEYKKEHDERMKNEREDRKRTYSQMLDKSKNVVADELLFTATHEFFKDKNINIELIELNPLKDLRIIKGNIEDLIEEGRNIKEGKDDYIQAILTDDGELINPMEKLKSVYPNTMLITRERKRNLSQNKGLAKGELRKRSKIDLFKDFYEAYGSGDYTDKKESVLTNTINQVLKEEVK